MGGSGWYVHVPKFSLALPVHSAMYAKFEVCNYVSVSKRILKVSELGVS